MVTVTAAVDSAVIAGVAKAALPVKLQARPAVGDAAFQVSVSVVAPDKPVTFPALDVDPVSIVPAEAVGIAPPRLSDPPMLELFKACISCHSPKSNSIDNPCRCRGICWSPRS